MSVTQNRPRSWLIFTSPCYIALYTYPGRSEYGYSLGDFISQPGQPIESRMAAKTSGTQNCAVMPGNQLSAAPRLADPGGDIHVLKINP